MRLSSLSLIPRVLNIPIHAPTAADFAKCRPELGGNIVALDCQTAVMNWPRGHTPAHYYLKNPAPSNSVKLPYTSHYGSCSVSVEHAGPTPFPDYLTMIPYQILGLAGYVIQSCAAEEGGMGGYVTHNVRSVGAYLGALHGIILPYRLALPYMGIGGNITNGAFVTISITSPDLYESRPGDTDPLWSGYASQLLRFLSTRPEYPPQLRGSLRDTARRSHDRLMAMSIGGAQTWWEGLAGIVRARNARIAADPDLEDTATSRLAENNGDEGVDPGKMTYQCDSGLGGPDPIDCEKLAYSGLNQPTDMQVLQPNVPQIYTEGTCSLGISSANATTISWAHLLTAFQTINTLCVQNPIAAVRGGRAYFGQQSVSSWINGKRDSVGNVNGSDALPLGVNATIWRHDAASEVSCEWQFAQKGSNVTGCEVG